MTLENFAPRPLSSKVLRAVFFDYKLTQTLWYSPLFFTAFTRGFSCDSQRTVQSRRRLRCKTSLDAMHNKRRCLPAKDPAADNEVEEVPEACMCVDPCAELTAMLHCEVMSAFSDFSGGIGRGDEGPPWRALSCHSRLLDHIRKKHTDLVKFVCNGTKQLKVIMSMYSLDSFTGRHPGHYLQRSSDLIRVSASLGGSATHNSIDRILCVVLTGNGPTMVHTSTLGAVHKVRRVGNVLFTRCYAEVFLRLVLLNDSRRRRCMDLFQTFSIIGIPAPPLEDLHLVL